MAEPGAELTANRKAPLVADLAGQFEALARPGDTTSDLRFSAAPVEEHPGHRIAVDRHGLPALLISVAGDDRVGPPLVLEHIQMQKGVDCRLTEPDGTTTSQRFTIIRCTDDDPSTREYFLRVGGTVLDAIGGQPNSETVSRTIENLVELFRALTAPPRKSVVGLWGELFVIAYSRDPATLVQAWHRSPDERFDFAHGTERLEVKTANGRARRHHFSLEQLIPLPGIQILIASLLVERSTAGPSVSDLLESIKSAVSSDAAQVLHVDTVVALTLSSGWKRAMDERFDAALSESSLVFFEPPVIPKPEVPVPPEVTELRFVSDLGNCPAAPVTAYAHGSVLLKAAMDRCVHLQPSARTAGRLQG